MPITPTTVGVLRWWIAGAVAVLAAVAVPLAAGSSGVRADPRAYPADDGGRTLDAGLDEAGIRVPDCLRNDALRYALLPDREHLRVHLHLIGSADCVNSFLLLNDYADGRGGSPITDLPEKVPTRAPAWMTEGRAREFGWSVAPGRRVHVFGGGFPYAVGVVVQQSDGAGYHAYVHAFYGH